jgi:hypothetical protein
MATISEIAQGINILKTAYSNYQPDLKLTAELWMAILGDVPGETLKAAIIQCLAEQARQFAPAIGEIRHAALRINAKAAGIPEAWQAFDEVYRMPADMTSRELILEDGQNIILEKALAFTHPLVESVARMMGWPQSFPTDMPAADRSQFIKAYDAEFARMLGDAGRLKIVDDYIEKRRAALGGNALALTASVTKQLERK